MPQPAPSPAHRKVFGGIDLQRLAPPFEVVSGLGREGGGLHRFWGFDHSQASRCAGRRSTGSPEGAFTKANSQSCMGAAAGWHELHLRSTEAALLERIELAA